MEMNEMNFDVTEEKPKDDEAAMEKLEEALLLSKFGLFNIRLLIASLTLNLTIRSCIGAASFILPSAECDLEMNNIQKGLLNSAPFIGLMSTAIIAGYFSSAFGRRRFLIAGTLMMSICCILEGSSQKYWMLMLWKIFEGIGWALCQNNSSVLIAEFTHSGIRDKVLLYFKCFNVISAVGDNLIAWCILSKNWSYNLWDGYFELHPWNVYLWVCSIWGMLAALQYYFLPESPKFLLANGRSDEALEVLRKIYNQNTGKPKNSLPITFLTILPQSQDKKSVTKQLSEAWYNAKFLFQKPLAYHLISTSFISFVLCWAQSALRLWYPQLSTLIEYYQKDHSKTDKFCTMIDSFMVSNLTTSEIDSTKVCVPKLSTAVTYINTLMINITCFLCLIVSSFLVDWISVKNLIISGIVISSGCIAGLYWADTLPEITGILAVTIAFLQLSSGLQRNMVVRIFPTTLRSLALSMVSTISRSGSVTGNILFAVMLQKGCELSFGIILSCCCGPYTKQAGNIGSGVTSARAGGGGSLTGVAVLAYFLPVPKKGNKETNDR